MQTSDCSVIKEIPTLVNIASSDERHKLDDLGQQIAAKEHLHYEGYVAFTDFPYSVSEAKTTLFFD